MAAFVPLENYAMCAIGIKFWAHLRTDPIAISPLSTSTLTTAELRKCSSVNICQSILPLSTSLSPPAPITYNYAGAQLCLENNAKITIGRIQRKKRLGLYQACMPEWVILWTLRILCTQSRPREPDSGNYCEIERNDYERYFLYIMKSHC